MPTPFFVSVRLRTCSNHSASFQSKLEDYCVKQNAWMVSPFTKIICVFKNSKCGFKLFSICKIRNWYRQAWVHIQNDIGTDERMKIFEKNLGVFFLPGGVKIMDTCRTQWILWKSIFEPLSVSGLFWGYLSSNFQGSVLADIACMSQTGSGKSGLVPAESSLFFPFCTSDDFP